MKTLLTFIGLALACLIATAAEKKIDRKAVPAAVEAAIRKEEAKGATVKGITSEEEQGRTTYEVETTVGGKSRDLVFSAAGAIIETEDEVAIGSIPAAARSAFEGQGRVLKVEKVTKGSSVTFEAEVEKNGKKTEVAVDAAGKRIKS